MIDNVQQKNNSIQGKPEKKASLLLPIIVAAVIFVAMVVSILISAEYDFFADTSTDIEPKKHYHYNIESVGVEDSYLIIHGWFFEQGKSTTDTESQERLAAMCIVLQSQDEQNPKMYFLKTTLGLPRYDVNEYYSSTYDYTNSGFYASINISEIENPNGCYEILIMPDVNGTEYINTSQYINNLQWQY